jgi:hypothetical protein
VKPVRGCDSCTAPVRVFYDGRRWLCASCWRETHGTDPPSGGVVRD